MPENIGTYFKSLENGNGHGINLFKVGVKRVNYCFKTSEQKKYYKMLRDENKEIYLLQSTGFHSLKKLFILLIIVVLALAFDGSLAKDIFDYQLSGFADWLSAILIVAILLTIAWAGSAKNTDNKNPPE